MQMLKSVFDPNIVSIKNVDIATSKIKLTINKEVTELAMVKRFLTIQHNISNKILTEHKNFKFMLRFETRLEQNTNI